MSHTIDPTRPFFADTAKILVNNGWSVFPQTVDRRPGIAGGRAIRPLSDNNLAERLPYPRELEQWIRFCGDLNVAAMMGNGSGRAVTIDIDVTDSALAQQVIDLALDVFGYTPLQRIGRAPKMALLYRSASQGELLPNRTVHAVEGGHGIDILSRAKALSFFGNHHVTGRQFMWPKKTPLRVRPDEVPAVSMEQMAAFFRRVHYIMPLCIHAERPDVSPESEEADYSTSAFTPRQQVVDGTLAKARLAWRAHADDPKLGDLGQVQLIYKIVQRMLASGWNPGLIPKAGDLELQQTRDEYTTDIAETVKNLLKNPNEIELLNQLSAQGMRAGPTGGPQYHLKNWTQREAAAGAR